MTDHPDYSLWIRLANDALSTLKRFWKENPLVTTTGPPTCALPSAPDPTPATTYAPPPIPYRLPPMAPGIPIFDPSHLFPPSMAYASGHATQHQYPSAGHMPSIAPPAPRPQMYIPKIYREPLIDITREMVFDRVFLLLQESLSRWWFHHGAALFDVTTTMTDMIISRGRAGAFGPNGISSMTQIFLCIGHEGIYHYMCLATHSGYGSIHVFLKGERREKEGRDPMVCREVMALCREGFEQAAFKAYEIISGKSSRRQPAR